MTAKKITGSCEAGTGWEDRNGHPVVLMCREPARFYRYSGPFRFGLYLCDDHKDLANA